jgi:hypothetical protein
MRLLNGVLALSLGVSGIFAQGPTLSYLAGPGTELPWAECNVHLQGGSKHKIPFLPVVNSRWAPAGTDKYTRDVRLDAQLVFVGDGVVRDGFDPYRGLDVSGKIVLLSFDFPDTLHPGLEKEYPLDRRVGEAVSRQAAGIVVFSWTEEYPFPRYQDMDAVPEIPIIAVNRRSAEVILESAGLDAERLFKAWKSEGKFQPSPLISRLMLRIDGTFGRVSSDNFDVYYEKPRIAAEKVSALVDVNERSVKFILDLFTADTPKWRKTATTYFRDYDSKLFFTHHWGSGASSDAGIFMVFDGAVPNFGLAVHENTHMLIGENWGGSTSFLNEGLGKYAEAMATDRDANDRVTAAFLKDSKLVPLERMLAMRIGSDPATEVAYPAAGSFVGFLIRTYSLARLKVVFQGANKPDIWRTAFGIPLVQLEKEWLSTLR